MNTLRPAISPFMDRRQACTRALSNFRADSCQEPEHVVSYAHCDQPFHSSAESERIRSAPRASPSTSPTFTRMPFFPVSIASSGHPVLVETTGVRQAIASIAGRLNPSLRLAVIQTSHWE